MTAATIPQTASSRIPLSYVVALIPVAAALNIVGSTINTALGLPTFLDMIGTAVVAIVLGPWWGALAGVITNIGGALILGPANIPFALVNVTGALVWGYGVRSFGMGASTMRFFVLNVVVALATSAVAAPIVVFVFGGATGHPSDALTAVFAHAGQGLFTAVLASNVLVTLADKTISGFVALTVIEALPTYLTHGIRLPAPGGVRPVLIGVAGVAVGVGFLLLYLLLVKPAQPA
jgi:energy-coupling factor transport system substrate-specific component